MVFRVKKPNSPMVQVSSIPLDSLFLQPCFHSTDLSASQKLKLEEASALERKVLQDSHVDQLSNPPLRLELSMTDIQNFASII